MSKMQKEFSKENSPDDGIEPAPEKITETAQARPVASKGNPEQMRLADLQEIERRYQTVFEAAPIGIAIADPQGYFLEANEAFIKMLGYNRRDIGDITFVDITHPEDRAETLGLSQEVRDGKIDFYRSEKRYLTKNGDVVWVVVRATAVRHADGSIKYWLGLMEDISERLESEEALRQSEEKYRNILEGIEEGYFEVDLAGNFTFFNDAMCNIFGFSRAELMGTNNRDYTSRKTSKKMYHVFNRVYRTGRSARVLNYEINTKDGNKKVLAVSASLLRNSDRELIGFRGFARDVTEHLIAEKEKERMAAQIRQARKMEAIGTLAGGIAHDFNNLLMGFQGNLSLMLMEMSPDNPDYEYLVNMEGYVKRGSDLTRQILGFARGGKYEVRPTNLNDLIEQSSQMFSRTRKEILIHKKFQKSPWPVEVDRGQIEQVLLNLFVNAWQAMPSGGDIFISTENVPLKEDDPDRPYALNQGEYVRISVADTGAGMDKDTLERIFEPFYTTKEVSRGTGLGLASAYGIIKNHSGLIDVTSEPGLGATFTIYLPKSNKDFLAERPAAEETIAGRETILLVDDEEMITDIGGKMLKKLGYRVVLAGSGRKALRLFDKLHGKIDLVILDMIMPEMGGSETFDQLKAISPDIKVLLSSGYSLDGQASQIMKRGCRGFIQKPFNLKHFSKKVREILDA
jgi:two-component system cell cycle sensor histidine kinase/response regulator CckA